MNNYRIVHILITTKDYNRLLGHKRNHEKEYSLKLPLTKLCNDCIELTFDMRISDVLPSLINREYALAKNSGEETKSVALTLPPDIYQEFKLMKKFIGINIPLSEIARCFVFKGFDEIVDLECYD